MSKTVTETVHDMTCQGCGAKVQVAWPASSAPGKLFRCSGGAHAAKLPAITTEYRDELRKAAEAIKGPDGKVVRPLRAIFV